MLLPRAVLTLMQVLGVGGFYFVKLKMSYYLEVLDKLS